MTCKVVAGAVFMAGLLWCAQAQVNCSATGAGRFANPSDTTCKNYTLCVYVASTDTYVSYDYNCPTSSVFSTITNLCTASSNFVCNVTLTNSTTSVCTTEGYIADPSVRDCSSYIMCTLIDGKYVQTPMECPPATYYDPSTTFCESNYICPVAAFNCTAAGRFADTTDTTCQKYFMCVLLSTGLYEQYNYTCPTTSVFNPNSRVCTGSYTCTNLLDVIF